MAIWPRGPQRYFWWFPVLGLLGRYGDILVTSRLLLLLGAIVGAVAGLVVAGGDTLKSFGYSGKW
jgi:hypothetical protein